MSTTISPDSSPTDDETIQRVLFLSPSVHIYTVPPLTSTKGYTTTSWSPLISPPPQPQPITTRLRVLETSSSTSSSTPSLSTPNGTPSPQQQQQHQQQKIETSILLEDPIGALFAACPYTSPLAVQPTTDSSRFFALRVEGDGGRMKAVLGIGFEERGEAMDFGICLQGVRKVMGMDVNDNGGGVGNRVGKGKKGEKEVKRDWGLKEGETIRVEIGGMGMGMGTGEGVESRRRRDGGEEEGALFSIKPPPSSSETGKGGGMPLLAPPPSARDVKAERRRSREAGIIPEKGSAAELGFDDGEFGEFQ